MRRVGRLSEHRTPVKRVPRLSLGILSLLGVVLAALVGFIPVVVPVGYAVLSTLSYALYAGDKRAAEADRQRTPEATLHIVDLLGGWPGALMAQQRFRHKTVKASFQSVFWLTVLANIAVVAWLVHRGIARALADGMFGGLVTHLALTNAGIA